MAAAKVVCLAALVRFHASQNSQTQPATLGKGDIPPGGCASSILLTCPLRPSTNCFESSALAGGNFLGGGPCLAALQNLAVITWWSDILQEGGSLMPDPWISQAFRTKT